MLFLTKYLSIQPARDFWPQESHHFVSMLRYLIQFFALALFDCGFMVRLVVGLGPVLVLFFCIFPFPMYVKTENYHQVDCLRGLAVQRSS